MLLRTCLVTLLLLALRPLPAGAALRFGIELTGALGRYDMAAFNDTLRSLNQVAGIGFGEISDGAAVGGNLRLWANDDVLIRIGLQKWGAVTKNRGYKFDVGAWAFQGGVTYYLDGGAPFRIGLGAGFDNLNLSGGLGGPGVGLDGSGYGFGGHGTLEAVVPLRPRWSGIVTLGYRFAKIDVLKLANQDTGGRPDYRGPYLQVGVAIDDR